MRPRSSGGCRGSDAECGRAWSRRRWKAGRQFADRTVVRGAGRDALVAKSLGHRVGPEELGPVLRSFVGEHRLALDPVLWLMGQQPSTKRAVSVPLSSPKMVTTTAHQVKTSMAVRWSSVPRPVPRRCPGRRARPSRDGQVEPEWLVVSSRLGHKPVVPAARADARARRWLGRSTSTVGPDDLVAAQATGSRAVARPPRATGLWQVEGGRQALSPKEP